MLKLPRRDLPREQDIELAIGPMFHLWQEEVGHEETYARGPAPYVAAFPGEVPACRVEQLGGDYRIKDSQLSIQSSARGMSRGWEYSR